MLIKLKVYVNKIINFISKNLISYLKCFPKNLFKAIFKDLITK